MHTEEDSGTQKQARVRSIPGDAMCQNILRLTDWVESQDGPNDCTSCDLATIAPWYRDLLQNKGYPNLAAKIQNLAEGEHPDSEIASVLDEVKAGVHDKEVERELLLYDCMMQKYKEVE